MLRSAVILAGGRGTRMWPFADVRNKCALPVANVPNIRRTVDTLARLGIAQVVVVLGEQPGSVRHALMGCQPQPLYVTQETGSGTAGAALAGLQTVADEPSILVIYGDVVVAEDTLRAFLEGWRSSGARAALLYDEVHPVEGGDWYGVHISNERVEELVGHETGCNLRWCGVVIVPGDITDVLVNNPGRMLNVPVGGMPPPEPDFAQSLNDWRGEMVALRAAGFVVDMDKPWHILEANARMAHHLTSALQEDCLHETAVVEDGADIHGRLLLGPRSRIGKRVVVSGNLIVGSDTVITNGAILNGCNIVGDRTAIRDYCLVSERTVVGSRCIIGHGAEMDGVMFDGSYLYHYCEISGVVGASVDIGAATVCGTLRFDDGMAEHRIRGRRERPLMEANATFFGDHSRTGVNVITMPGTKIGAYSCVGAGIVVYEDVPSRTLLLLRQETVTRPWGPERYGW